MAKKTKKIPKKEPINKSKRKKNEKKGRKITNKNINEKPMVEHERYWTPFEMMRQFEREMDDFKRSFETRFAQPRRWHDRSVFRFPNVRQPLLDIEDTGKNILVTAEMPGIPKKNIDINVRNDHIEISAKVGQDKEEKGKDYYHSERSFHSFYRQIPLPTEVDQTKADAELKDGILKIKLPKKEPKLKEKSKKVIVR